MAKKSLMHDRFKSACPYCEYEPCRCEKEKTDEESKYPICSKCLAWPCSCSDNI